MKTGLVYGVCVVLRRTRASVGDAVSRFLPLPASGQANPLQIHPTGEKLVKRAGKILKCDMLW